jgi:hypothetical protein
LTDFAHQFISLFVYGLDTLDIYNAISLLKVALGDPYRTGVVDPYVVTIRRLFGALVRLIVIVEQLISHFLFVY